jgi:hypothetical protein
MTRRNERSVNFHEFLTLRRDRKRRIAFNRLNRLNFDCRSYSRKISQDQNQQFQNRDNDAKSIEMQ